MSHQLAKSLPYTYEDKARQRLFRSIALKKFQIQHFQCKLDFSFNVQNLEVRTARTPDQLEKLFELRYEVYRPKGLSHIGLDLDEYDLKADHLMVLDRESNKLLGTYRLLFSEFTDSFYSSTEFQIEDLLNLSGAKLELGRAAVLPEARDGLAIQALWFGLAHYIKLTNPEILFGCSSVMSTDAIRVHSVDQYLNQYRHPDIQLSVQPKYYWPWGHHNNSTDQGDSGRVLLDPLLRIYLKAGAKIAGGPALDVNFGCVDYLTILEVKKLSQSFQRKFLGR